MNLKHEAQLNNNPAATLLTSRELAAMLGLKPRTVDMMRVSADGCPYIKIGRLVRYRLSDVELWLSQHERRSTSDTNG